MTTVARSAAPADVAVLPAPAIAFEVATTCADALRANVRVDGRLDARTCPLVASILRSHLTAGRRYLRLRLTDADPHDPAVRSLLVQAHREVARTGGTLLIHDAPVELVAALAGDGVLVRAGD